MNPYEAGFSRDIFTDLKCPDCGGLLKDCRHTFYDLDSSICGITFANETLKVILKKTKVIGFVELANSLKNHPMTATKPKATSNSNCERLAVQLMKVWEKDNKGNKYELDFRNLASRTRD